MEFIDSHTHLYSKSFSSDREEMIARAQEKGLTKFYLPNIDSTSIEGMLELEKNYPGTCIPMMGLHPCSVKDNVMEELAIVGEWLEKREFAAVGEIGIDLYWEKENLKTQQMAFRFQIDLALKHGLPIVIHSRDSFEEVLDVLREYKGSGLTGILHCFTGSLEQAQELVRLGFLLGIGGVVTYKNGGLEPVIREIGLESLVLETDSPYLSPVPYRGKRNESSYVPIIAQRVADIKEISLDEVASITSGNAQRIFKEIIL